MTGMIDWVTVPPAEVLRELMKQQPPRNDFNPAPQLTTYYFLLNTTRPPLDDKRVRQALSLAIDREEITRVATGAGEIPALQPGAAFDARLPQAAVQAVQSRGRAKIAGRGGLPGRAGLSRNSKFFTTPTSSTRRLPSLFANSGRTTWESPRRCAMKNGDRSRIRAAVEVHRRPPSVGGRLHGPEHLSRHVRHGRRKQ